MTTNITPREALEKISNISEINDCTCFYEDFKNCNTCDANKGCAYYIATQALAPQEPQQKTFTQYEVRDILNEVLLDYLDKPSVDAYRLDVLKKLEKAVGYMKSKFLDDEKCRWLEKYTNKCMFWMPDSKFKCEYIGRCSQCDEFQQIIE